MRLEDVAFRLARRRHRLGTSRRLVVAVDVHASLPRTARHASFKDDVLRVKGVHVLDGIPKFPYIYSFPPVNFEHADEEVIHLV